MSDKKDLTEFFNWLAINCSSKETVFIHLIKVKTFFLNYDEFNQENVNKFFLEKQTKWANTTFNIYLNSLKHYATFSKLEIEFPKYRTIDLRVKPYISEKELDEILIKLPMLFRDADKIKTILTFMFETGVRPKELFTLKRTDFDLDEKHFVLRDTKTHRDRKIVLSNSNVKMIKNYFQQEAEKINAFNMSKFTLKYVFNQINTCLNLKKRISPYTMRRAYAHNILKKGGTLPHLQLGMGHKNITTTLGYLTVDADEANKEIRKIINHKRKR